MNAAELLENTLSPSTTRLLSLFVAHPFPAGRRYASKCHPENGECLGQLRTSVRWPLRHTHTDSICNPSTCSCSRPSSATRTSPSMCATPPALPSKMLSLPEYVFYILSGSIAPLSAAHMRSIATGGQPPDRLGQPMAQPA